MTPEQSPKNNASSANRDSARPGITAPWRGLTLQLFLVTVLPLTALLLIFTFGSLEMHQHAMRRLVGERDALAVRTAAGAIAEQVRQRTNAMRMLSLQAEGRDNPDLQALLSAANFLQTDFDYGLAFYTPDGALEAAQGNIAMWESLAGALSPHLQGLVAGGLSPTDILYPPVIPNASTLPDTGERLVIILAIDATRQRITAGAFSAASLAQRVFGDDLSNARPTSFILVDRDRQLVYQVGDLFTEDEISSHAGVAEALRGESGAAYQRAADGEHVVAYSPVETLGWGLVSEEPWEQVDTAMLRTTQAAPLILAPVLILALAALAFAVRQVIRPLQDLETKSAQLAGGNFQAIESEVGGIAEIRHLQAELIHMARQVKAAQQSLHNYIGAITAAQEEERRRLARELHDETIQALIALKQRLQLARMNLGGIPAPASLDEIISLTEQTIEELRRLTRALRPIYLEDLGLATALEMLAHEAGQSASIEVQFTCQGTERRLAPETELALYRMAQEALSNVARHAQAKKASLSIIFSPEAVRLEINDDGKGFEVPKNPAEFAPGGHFGLLGLHERADLIGARLKIDSALGKGTRLSVTILTMSNLRNSGD